MNKLNLDFGMFSINLGRVISLLKRDLDDDWFLDPLQYKDMFKHEKIINYFESNIAKNNGIYNPISRIEMNVPKKKDTLRYSLETCLYDRIAYHAYAEILIEHFDSFLSRRVFNHRLDVRSFKQIRPKYLFLNAIEQWKKFEEFVKVEAENKSILITDIQNYFEKINITILENTLFECLNSIKVSGLVKARIRFSIEVLCRALKTWSFTNSNGLPQNRDVSSFLANIYMLPVDNFMIENQYDYYRYMDDIRIICKDKYHARNSLKELINRLRLIGLNVNAAKTNILNPGTKEHESFLKSTSFELERIDSMINSKKKPIVALAFNKVREKIILLLNESKIEGRDFRFYINRIEKIALCQDIKKPEDYFSPITELIISLIPEVPYAMDQLYKYLVSVSLSKNQLKIIEGFLIDQDKMIYGWQNYLIWKLFISKDFKSTNLMKLCESIIVSGRKVANTCGALLYLGKFGDKSTKTFITKNFSLFNNFLLQRHALIAIQDLKWTEIKSDIQEEVSDESYGIYRELNSYTIPIYLEPPRSIRYSELIREISFYA